MGGVIPLCMALLCANMLSHAAIACSIAYSSSSVIFTYDGHGQNTIGYNEIAKPGFVYDAGTVLGAGEKKPDATRESGFSAKIAEFLAADGGGSFVFYS